MNDKRRYPAPTHPRRYRFKRTLQLRLTLIYGGLFFVAGVVLLGVTYVLVGYQVTRTGTVVTARLPDPKASPSTAQASSSKVPILRTTDGDVLFTSETAHKFLAREQAKIRNSTQTSLLTQGAIALVLVGSASAGFGWLITGRVLAPLHRVTETARRIADARAADRGLHERIGLTGPNDEVHELADTFDAMLQRLDRSFESQRRFVANASHELRTPITLNRALVEVAMHRRTASPDVKQLGETLLEINARHERLITGLLLLARSEGEVPRRNEVDLADVVTHVVAQSAAEATQAGITVREYPEQARTTGDPVLLERLAQNLVDNGIRHNLPEGGFVEVTSRTVTGDRTITGNRAETGDRVGTADRAGTGDRAETRNRGEAGDQGEPRNRAEAGNLRKPGNRVELVVANSGPVIPPYEVPMLFEPFRRLGDERLVTAKGAGLGLSIVRSVARAHGGEATAVPRQGGGLVVTVTLPIDESRIEP